MKSRRFSAFNRPIGVLFISVMLMISLCLTGCELSSISKENSSTLPPNNSETEGKTDLNNNDVENKEDEKVDPPTAVFYNVLTGLETSSELAALRPVAIALENTPYSLPQYGISDADMLIEVPTADGMSKLMLLTTDYRYMTTIGALTSTRPYLAALSDSFGAIHCFNGSDGTMTEDALASIPALDAENKLLSGVFYKDETRFNQDDVMTNGILIDSGIRRAELESQLGEYTLPYTFCESGGCVTPGTDRAQEISIRYSSDATTVFRYNETTGEYDRTQFGTATLDGTNNQQVSFKNVMILYASSTTYESQSNKTLDFVFTDGGTGTYSANGRSMTFNWTMDDTGALHFTDEAGNILEINRGTTYMGVLPVGQQSNAYIH